MNNLTFTIDTKAHLRKMSESTFSEKEYYLVELIRESVKRKATEINVTLTNSIIKLEDNGDGIDSENLKQLISIYSDFESFEKKESFIECLTDGSHLGMIALFSPNPEKIVIDNKVSTKDNEEFNKISLVFSNNKVEKYNSQLVEKGTVIEIHRNCENIEDEKKIILKYFKKIDKSCGFNIFLNESRILPEGNLSKCVLLEKFKIDNKLSTIGIPVQGNICRITLTYCGIPWSLEMFHPIGGYVFDIVIESKNNLNNLDFSQLLNKIHKLYKWLGEIYSKLPLSHKERFRELIELFISKNKDGDSFYDFEIFKTTEDKFISLNKIKSYAQVGPISVINQNFKSQNQIYNEECTLVLNNKDIDFLTNKMKIQLNFLNNSPNVEKRGEKIYVFLDNIKNSLFNFADKLGRSHKIINITKEQYRFKKEMKELFNGIYDDVLFSSQKGFKSYHIEKQKNKVYLIVHLKHPVSQNLIPLMYDKSHKILAWHLYGNLKERRKRRTGK